jgi:hypothetical protein
MGNTSLGITLHMCVSNSSVDAAISSEVQILTLVKQLCNNTPKRTQHLRDMVGRMWKSNSVKFVFNFSVGGLTLKMCPGVH